MSRKGKKDDAAELEPAEDVSHAAGAAAVVDAGDAGAGPAGEAETVDAVASDEKPADAEAAGEVPGAADANADEAHAAQPETATETDAAGSEIGAADDTTEHVHVPADYEVDAPFKVGDGVYLLGRPSAAGVVSEIHPNQSVSVAWDDAETSTQPFETVALLDYDGGLADELDDDAPQIEPLTPREIAIIAAGGAAFRAFEALERDDGRNLLPTKQRHLELFDILDLSPDLPASAIAQQLSKDELPEAVAEALRAAYVGLQPWVKAEEARRAPPPAPLLRKGGYEKSGRVDPAPERIVSPAEAERMRRNRAGSAD